MAATGKQQARPGSRLLGQSGTASTAVKVETITSPARRITLNQTEG